MHKTPAHSLPETAPDVWASKHTRLAPACLACGSNSEFWSTLLTKGLLQPRAGLSPGLQASVCSSLRVLRASQGSGRPDPCFPGGPQAAGLPPPGPHGLHPGLLTPPGRHPPSRDMAATLPQGRFRVWSRAQRSPALFLSVPRGCPPAMFMRIVCNVPGEGSPLLPCPRGGSAPPSLGYFPGCPVSLFLSVCRLWDRHPGPKKTSKTWPWSRKSLLGSRQL